MPKKERSQDEGEEIETTEEAMPEQAAPSVEPSNDGLVKVALGGETLHVHPTALDEHLKLGWKKA